MVRKEIHERLAFERKYINQKKFRVLTRKISRRFQIKSRTWFRNPVMTSEEFILISKWNYTQSSEPYPEEIFHPEIPEDIDKFWWKTMPETDNCNFFEALFLDSCKYDQK